LTIILTRDTILSRDTNIVTCHTRDLTLGMTTGREGDGFAIPYPLAKLGCDRGSHGSPIFFLIFFIYIYIFFKIILYIIYIKIILWKIIIKDKIKNFNRDINL